MVCKDTAFFRNMQIFSIYFNKKTTHIVFLAQNLETTEEEKKMCFLSADSIRALVKHSLRSALFKASSLRSADRARDTDPPDSRSVTTP